MPSALKAAFKKRQLDAVLSWGSPTQGRRPEATAEKRKKQDREPVGEQTNVNVNADELNSSSSVAGAKAVDPLLYYVDGCLNARLEHEQASAPALSTLLEEAKEVFGLLTSPAAFDLSGSTPHNRAPVLRPNMLLAAQSIAIRSDPGSAASDPGLFDEICPKGVASVTLPRWIKVLRAKHDEMEAASNGRGGKWLHDLNFALREGSLHPIAQRYIEHRAGPMPTLADLLSGSQETFETLTPWQYGAGGAPGLRREALCQAQSDPGLFDAIDTPGSGEIPLLSWVAYMKQNHTEMEESGQGSGFSWLRDLLFEIWIGTRHPAVLAHVRHMAEPVPPGMSTETEAIRVYRLMTNGKDEISQEDATCTQAKAVLEGQSWMSEAQWIESVKHRVEAVEKAKPGTGCRWLYDFGFAVTQSCLDPHAEAHILHGLQPVPPLSESLAQADRNFQSLTQGGEEGWASKADFTAARQNDALFEAVSEGQGGGHGERVLSTVSVVEWIE